MKIKKKLWMRLIILIVLIILNVFLGKKFIEDASPRLSPETSKMLSKLGIDPSKLNMKVPKTVEQYRTELDPSLIIEQVNSIRVENNLEKLEENQELTLTAQYLLDEASEYDYDFDKYPLEERVEQLIKESNYDYSRLAQSTLVGPLTVNAVISAWESNETPNEAFIDDTAQDIGIATTVVETDQFGMVGIVIQLLGEESSGVAQSAGSSVQVKKPALTFADISDEEVLAALNDYRAAHGHEPLTEEGHLCSYAQKRVGDLVAYGSLDAHQGFQNDFADNQAPPQLEGYPGTQFGENLAYQYCRNMTTGESFIAETGTSIIEWCFDSSTKGHREAQLSTVFKHACVRHDQGMFVVIFGN